MRSVTLSPLCRLSVNLGPVEEAGQHPSGRKRIIPIIGGTVEGKRLNGTILPIGADWQTVWEDGSAQLDTRYSFKTRDGAIVEISNFGYRTGPADVLARLAAAEAVDPTLYSMRTQARFATGDARYAWLNTLLAVGTGIREPSCVIVDLHAIDQEMPNE